VVRRQCVHCRITTSAEAAAGGCATACHVRATHIVRHHLSLRRLADKEFQISAVDLARREHLEWADYWSNVGVRGVEWDFSR